MTRTLRQDLEQDLQDQEFLKLYGAAQAKAEFAIALATARTNAGITQAQLAEKLGRSQPYISRLEGGDANPTLGTVGLILALLNLRLAMKAVPLISGTSSIGSGGALGYEPPKYGPTGFASGGTEMMYNLFDISRSSSQVAAASGTVAQDLVFAGACNR